MAADGLKNPLVDATPFVAAVVDEQVKQPRGAAVGPGRRERAAAFRPRRMKGADSAARLRELSQLRRTLGLPADVVVATLAGNNLIIEGTEIELIPNPTLDWQSETLSSRLGENRVFYFQATDRRELGLAALMEGGAYTVFLVGQDGEHATTGFGVVTRGFAGHDGILAFTGGMVFLPVLEVQGRRPRDTQAIARQIRAVLDLQGKFANRAISATHLLLQLEPQRLTPTEIMEVLEFLERQGTLAQFLNHVSVPKFREYLRGMEVDWSYIYSHWEASLHDSGAFFMGFLIGAAENVTDVVVLIYTLVGSVFSEELAKQRDKFFGAIKQFFLHPIVMAEQGLSLLAETTEEHLWNLRFFEAGRIFGNLTVVVLTLPAAIKALPGAAQAAAKVLKTGAAQATKLLEDAAVLAAKGAVALAQITLRELTELGVRISQLVEIALQPRQVLALDGFHLVASGDDFLLLAQNGLKPRRFPIKGLMDELKQRVTMFKQGRNGGGGGGDGRHTGAAPDSDPAGNPFEDLTDSEIDDLLDQWEKDLAGTAGEIDDPGKAAQAAEAGQLLKTAQLEDLVQSGIRQLMKEKGSGWMPNRIFGTRLHTILEELLERHLSGAGFRVDVEVPLKDMPSVPEAVKGMTIREFIAANPEYHLPEEQLSRIFRSLDQKIRDLRPDLVIQNEAQIIVWDLTAQSSAEHFAKTLFYSKVLNDGKRLSTIGETYWRHFASKKNFDGRDFYGFPAIASQGRDVEYGTTSTPHESAP